MIKCGGYMNIQAKGIKKLDAPIWFDTGLKMQNGQTPITVAAYDTKQLLEYKEKKSYLGTFDKDGLENFVLWSRLGNKEEIQIDDADTVSGVTGTHARRKI